MSTKHVRSISDFSRFRKDVDVQCSCGHKATLPFGLVVGRFVTMGWPKGLGSALRHFRCSKCGSTAAHIGPKER